VKLKRSGSGMGGLCPFHNEKTPSFKVSPNLGIYKCFGCGRGGNVVDFVMEIEKLTYPEALRHLASKYHIEIEEDNSNREELSEQVKLREGLYVALAFAQKYFTDQLLNDTEGKAVGYSYFKERGITDQTIERFGLGYGKNSWDEFLNHAQSNGYDLDILVKAGLIKERQNDSSEEKSYYDTYRERVMFPIHNLTGKVVGFGGRHLTKDKKSPKYINSPESEVYHKSSILYGLYHAKKAIREKEEVLLVEGYLDVLMLAQSGIEHVVATSGTALTVDQVKLVKRFADKAVMLYDGDPAGIKAAIRGVDLLLEGGLNVDVVVFPEGEDPDSYCRKLGGAGLETFIHEQRKNLVQFKTEVLLAEKGDTAIGRSETAREVLESVVKIPDPLKRNAFIKETSVLLDFEETLLQAEAKRLRHQLDRSGRNATQTTLIQPEVNASPEVKPSVDKRSKEYLLVESLILYAQEPYDEEVDMAGFIFSELDADGYGFEDAELADAVNEARTYYSFHDGLDESFFTKHKTLGKIAADTLSNKYKLSPVWSDTHEIFVKTDTENYKDVVQENLNYLKLFKLQFFFNKTMKQLEEAESEEDVLLLQRKIAKLLQVRKTITDTLGIEGALPEA